MQQFKPAHKALSEGRYDEAYLWLERLVEKNKENKLASFHVQLAALFALYGENGLEAGRACLDTAARHEAENLPLYQAVTLEFAAVEGGSAQTIRKGISSILTAGDPLAKFHAARALYLIGSYRRAASVLRELAPSTLPHYLQWRRWSLLGESYAQQAKFEEAIEAYHHAIKYSARQDKHLETLSLAECYLRTGRPDLALAALDEQAAEPIDDLLQTVRRHYLRGVAQRQIGNHALAFVSMHKAYTLAAEHGSLPFELLLELARLFAETDQLERALSNYECALNVVPAEQVVSVMHEYAHVLADAERYEEAAAALKMVASDARYHRRAEAFADLAEVSYMLGQFDKVGPLAKFALKGGIITPACLCLGRVALEYFHLDEAEAWFEQAISASTEGDSEWLTAQLLLAETFSQKADAPSRLIHHAELALKYLHPNDDWTATLRSYLETARTQLSGKAREVN
jgi:tetratricopeptide (TPR) repeat protein